MSYVMDGEDDDDFSPEDAFNMFTPSIYRPGSKDRADIDQLDVLAAPPGGDHLFTFDPQLAAATFSSIGFGGPAENIGRVPTDVLSSGGFGWKLGDNLSHVVLPTPSTDGDAYPDGWILGEREDAILLPAILSTIGFCAVLGNLLLLLTIVGLRRMRSGPNMMLANVALADLVFVAVTVPTAVVNHATKSRRLPYIDDDIIGPRVCRFVYYTIFVTVYVTVYTLVVSSVFRFFGELLRGSRRRSCVGGCGGGGGTGGGSRSGTMNRVGSKSLVNGVKSHGESAAPSSHSVPLSPCSAAVSCIVVWIAFASSHMTFFVQSDATGLAAFEKPVICVYSPSSGSGYGTDLSPGSADVSRVRTLWITFLACAFLLPLTIVCFTSASVLRMQKRAACNVRRMEVVDDDDRCRQLGSSAIGTGSRVLDDSTIMQNLDNDGRVKREMTTIIMVSAISRAVCWLPLQIFILIDVFGPEPEPEATADMYRKAEMFGVCMALVGACVGPPIYRLASREFRDAFRQVLRRICCCGRGASRRASRDPATYVSSRLIVREPSLPPQTLDYQHCLHRQSPISVMSSSSCYSHDHHHVIPLPHHPATAALGHHQQHRDHLHYQQQQQQYHRQQQVQLQQQQQQQLVLKHQLLARPEAQLMTPGRVPSTDVSETILSIISDSSNHINYA